MSNIDPFTQKLLLRTQARKEARLKRQVSGDYSTANVESLICNKEKVDSPTTKTPLSEKNEVDKSEVESSPGRSKKRLSSEQLNATPEKRPKSSKVPLSPRRDQETNSENVNPASPIQRVTIKASMQESPKQSLKSSSLAASLSELRKQYSQYLQINRETDCSKTVGCSTEVSSQCHKHSEYLQSNSPSTQYSDKVESSPQSRLNRLNQHYTEQLQIDYEEEQRRKEATVALEERKKEHQKEQEKERARLIQERIFGKNNQSKGNEEEKINELRQKYLGNAPKNPPTTIPKFQRLEQESAAYNISPRKQPEVTTHVPAHPKVTAHVPAHPKVTTHVPAKQKVTTHVPVQQKKLVNQIKVTNGDMTNKNLNNEDEKVFSVKDKKSIFEQKMKLEREASNKERETAEWLKMRNTRTASIIEMKDQNSPKKDDLSSDSDIIISSKPDSCKPELRKIEESHKDNDVSESKTLEHNDASESITDKISSENEDKPSNHVATIEPKLPIDLIKSTPISCASPIPKSISDHSLSSPSKNFAGDINSPQPVDCTDDTIYTDSRAFDLSSILAIAAHREEQQAHLKPTKTHANRCSTMKVEPFQLEGLPELNMTPIKNESEDEEEVLSDFAKALKNKGKSIKGADLKQKLDAIDTKFKPIQRSEKVEKTPNVNEKVDGTPNVEEKVKHNSKQKSHKRPEKPPRSHKRIDKIEEDGLNHVDKRYVDTPTGKSGVRTKKEKHLSAGCDDVISKPSENVTRKKMRKSSSFSEGLGSTPVKSGYNRELSEKFSAQSSDMPDMVFSKNQQIQSLLEEAASQQNIVLQASQALNVAECSSEDKSNSPEVIEGERLLLLATERRTVCLEEVKALKENDFDTCKLKDSDNIPPCKATLGLTDLKLPLNPEFVLSLKTRKLDIGVFHFVVVVSAGNKNVHSTKVVSCYDDLIDSSLVINNSIVMKNIPHDFTLSLKVFGMHSGRASDQITKLKKNSTSKESPGNLKNLFSKKNKEEDYSYHASPQTVFRTSNFKLVGETKLNLSLLGNGLTKYALIKVPSKCPLEGCIQMRANCKPEFSANVTGFLTVLEDVGGYTAWNRRWCVMKDNRILYWRYPDEEKKEQEPMGNIDLRYCSDKVVKVLARDICARPQTFELTIRRGLLPNDTENLVTTIDGKVTKIKYWVCCDDKEDRITWMESVNKQLSDSKAWRLKKVSVKSPIAHQV